MSMFLKEKKNPIHKNLSTATDGVPAMTVRHRFHRAKEAISKQFEAV